MGRLSTSYAARRINRHVWVGSATPERMRIHYLRFNIVNVVPQTFSCIICLPAPLRGAGHVTAQNTTTGRCNISGGCLQRLRQPPNSLSSQIRHKKQRRTRRQLRLGARESSSSSSRSARNATFDGGPIAGRQGLLLANRVGGVDPLSQSRREDLF